MPKFIRTKPPPCGPKFAPSPNATRALPRNHAAASFPGAPSALPSIHARYVASAGYRRSFGRLEARQGLARATLERSMRTLYRDGERELWLVVTLANAPARRLYESLSFVVEP